jgi:putative transcriptional regulator
MLGTTHDSETLDVPALLHEIHHRIEAAEKKRITHEEMANRLGISKRTYVEYLRGTNRPKGLGVMFHLLQMLERDDLLRVLTPSASQPVIHGSSHSSTTYQKEGQSQ